VPGNSPVGLRLPLDSVQYFDPAEQEELPERSLFADVDALPDGDHLIPETGAKFNNSKTFLKRRWWLR
jgi:uncharacterized protein (DUF2126 family)